MKTHFHKIAALVILLSAWGTSHADNWTGQDKTKHFIVGAAIGSGVAIATHNENYGIAAGVAVGALKEFYDSKHPQSHTASIKDFTATAIGAYAGAKIGGFIITPNRIVYTKTFN